MNKKLFIVQGVIPHYRVTLFNRINRTDKFKKISFFSSKKIKGAPKSNLKNSEFNVINYSVYNFFGIYFSSLFKSIFSLGRNDVVLLEGNFIFLHTWLFLFLSKIKNFKIVLWTIYRMPNSKQINIHIKHILFRFFDRILLYTEKEKKLVPKHIKKNIYFANNSIDIQNYGNTNFIRRSEDSKLFYKSGSKKFKLIYIGRLTKKPKLEMVLKYIKKTKLNVYFDIIGDGSEKEYLENLTKKLALSNKVNFIGSIYEEKILAKYMSDADIFVYPGSIGLSIFTAFANALPVITHNDFKNQAPEFYILKNKYNSITYFVNSQQSFNSNLDKYLKNYKLKYKYGLNAYQTITQKYSIEKMTNNIIQSLNF